MTGGRGPHGRMFFPRKLADSKTHAETMRQAASADMRVRTDISLSAQGVLTK